MTHLTPRDRVAELHRLAAADYAAGATLRERLGNQRPDLPEPSDLDVAIRVGQQLLDSDQLPSIREALRLLLRALGAEPKTPLPADPPPPVQAAIDLTAHGHDAYRLRKAREELDSPADLADDGAMARKVGRLEVAVEQLLELIAERGDYRALGGGQ